MFFQGRGPIFLAPLDANGNPGMSFQLCTDTFAISLATTPFDHFNKCGPVDVVDFHGIKDQSGSLDISFAEESDKIFAMGVLGTVTGAGSPGTVTAEALPLNIAVGDIYFLGGGHRHRAITALVITDDATPLTLNTDYTLDAASGKVTFLTAGPGGSPNDAFLAAYGYTDPASVSMFTSPAKEYFLNHEFINKANNNKPGSIELYRVRFDPANNLDFMSPELQIMDLKGSALANLNKLVTDLEMGQFGRRVGVA
jgi:hypothetical protein